MAKNKVWKQDHKSITWEMNIDSFQCLPYWVNNFMMFLVTIANQTFMATIETQHSLIFRASNLFSLKKLCSKSAEKKKQHCSKYTSKWTPLHRWLGSNHQFDFFSCSSCWFYLKAIFFFNTIFLKYVFCRVVWWEWTPIVMGVKGKWWEFYII